MKKLSVVVCGNYGASNLGDEAILDALCRVVNEAFDHPNITIMSANPEQTHEMMSKIHSELAYEVIPFFPAGPRSAWRMLWKKKFSHIFRNIKKADVFLLGGGGLFTDERPRAIVIWAIQVWVALFLKKPIYCIGQSVGPLTSSFGKKITAYIMKKAQYIAVRDVASTEILEQLGIHTAKAFNDLAFALPVPVKDSKMKHEAYVVISVRPWLKTPHRNRANYQSLARFIDWLYEHKKLRSLLIPFQTLDPNDNDLVPLRAIFHELRYPEAAKIQPFDADYRKTLRLIEKAHAVIGMRLHSLIFATLTHTPFLALSYSQKVDAFVKSLELENFIYDWKELSVGALIDGFENLEQHHGAIAKKLQHKSGYFKNQILAQTQLLRKVLSTESTD